MGLLSGIFGGGERPVTKRVHATGGWSVSIPAGFEAVDNGDSWQAFKDDRVVYVSSLIVQSASGRKMPAGELHAMGAKQWERSTSGDRFRFARGNVTGEARVARADPGWRLTGFMVTDGVIATCTIDFPAEGDRGWALDTWKSLEHR
jgi:hypothetical protein